MRGARVVGALLLLGHSTACGGTPTAAPSPSTSGSTAGSAYLRELIKVMQENSVNRLRIDWTAFQNQVLAKTPNAAAIADTYPAIELALGLLDDHHSYYAKANSSEYIGNPRFPAGCGVAAVADPDVPQDIGYVRVPAVGGFNDVVQAQSIQADVRARDRDGLVGWIVDLRGNGGGNMWPMLAGVGPVLGTGTAGYFIAPVGGALPWGYEPGASLLNGRVVVGITPYNLRQPNPRVAVLTDKRVASSGEAIAVAFRGRPATRTLGTETCGVPTANEGFALSDGAKLFLTTARDADRTMTVYDSPLPPDETIADPAAVVQRAVAWLRSGS